MRNKALHLFVCVLGWGWMCVLGHAINVVVVTLLTRAFGVTYLQLLKHYNCSPAAVAWVGAISMTCNGIFGKAIKVTLYYPHGVPNQRQRNCLFNSLSFRLTFKQTSKLHADGLLWEDKRSSDAKKRFHVRASSCASSRRRLTHAWHLGHGYVTTIQK